tara:strand:+ start:36416 stop:36703 length:288 start_codon:yes stop_codon:yes gene_type:complete
MAIETGIETLYKIEPEPFVDNGMRESGHKRRLIGRNIGVVDNDRFDTTERGNNPDTPPQVAAFPGFGINTDTVFKDLHCWAVIPDDCYFLGKRRK